jgi:hypothetical protein
MARLFVLALLVVATPAIALAQGSTSGFAAAARKRSARA